MERLGGMGRVPIWDADVIGDNFPCSATPLIPGLDDSKRKIDIREPKTDWQVPAAHGSGPHGKATGSRVKNHQRRKPKTDARPNDPPQ